MLIKTAVALVAVLLSLWLGAFIVEYFGLDTFSAWYSFPLFITRGVTLVLPVLFVVWPKGLR